MNKIKEIERYIIDHIDEEDAILKEINRETNLKVLSARMLSGHLQGQILSMLSKMIKPSFILEIGTFTGYSAICLANGLAESGKLITIEVDDEIASIAGKFLRKSEFADKIEFKTGNALEIIPTLDVLFDLVFIDADKRQYIDYYNQVFDKIKPDGYLIVDNTLWSGKVLEAIENTDEQTKGIIEFNNFIKNDNRVEKVILPVRDGISIIRKKTVLV